MSSNVVPLVGAPASASFRAMWRDRARLEWDAFCKHHPWYRRNAVPCLALEAIEQILDRHGTQTSWARFDASAFHHHIEARYAERSEDTLFVYLASIPMFFDFLFRRGLVPAPVVRRAFEQCEALNPETRREREREERLARRRQKRNEAARARRAAKRSAAPSEQR